MYFFVSQLAKSLTLNIKVQRINLNIFEYF